MRNSPSDVAAAPRDTLIWAWAVGLLAASMACLVPAVTPDAGAPVVAAVYPPWWSPPRVATAAARSTQIVRFAASPFIIIVRTPGPQALSRLRASGAVLFLNPILGLCTPRKAS